MALRAAASSPDTDVVLAFTVRDKGRETGFLLEDVGSFFWLRLLSGEGEEECVPGTLRVNTQEEEGEEEGKRMRVDVLDAAARTAVDAAAEGDLLVLGARLKTLDNQTV